MNRMLLGTKMFVIHNWCYEYNEDMTTLLVILILLFIFVTLVLRLVNYSVILSLFYGLPKSVSLHLSVTCLVCCSFMHVSYGWRHLICLLNRFRNWFFP